MIEDRVSAMQVHFLYSMTDSHVFMRQETNANVLVCSMYTRILNEAQNENKFGNFIGTANPNVINER